MKLVGTNILRDTDRQQTKRLSKRNGGGVESVAGRLSALKPSRAIPATANAQLTRLTALCIALDLNGGNQWVKQSIESMTGGWIIYGT